MFDKKSLIATAIITTGIMFTGCNSITVFNGDGVEFVHNDISFGYDRNPAFKSGVVDGCRTSSGKYTKNHTSFKANKSYRVGWERGRLKCKGEQ